MISPMISPKIKVMTPEDHLYADFKRFVEDRRHVSYGMALDELLNRRRRFESWMKADVMTTFSHYLHTEMSSIMQRLNGSPRIRPDHDAVDQRMIEAVQDIDAIVLWFILRDNDGWYIRIGCNEETTLAYLRLVAMGMDEIAFPEG